MIAAERRAGLLADLRRMINNQELSDVVFSCKDEKDVFASRILLMTRSDIFKRYFSDLPEEQAKSRGKRKSDLKPRISVPLNSINSYTILSILEVLHTGNMVQYLPFSSAEAEEIIQASKDLELPEVEKIVTEFDTRISELEVKENIASAALKLSVALESDTHTDKTLVEILSTIDLKPVHLRDLSERAFEHYLERTQSRIVPESPSFREFIRFRQVLLWCVTQICPDEAAEVVAKAVLDAKYKTVREKEYLKYILTKQPEHAIPKDRLLGLVDYRRIHAKLLEDVVSPLNVVPEGKIVEALAFQRKQPRQYTWEHGYRSSYRIKKNNYSEYPSIAKSTSGVGFARFSMPIYRDYGVYEWTIVVEELPNMFCEIGFYKVDGLHESEFTGSSLIQQPTGMALRSYWKDGRQKTAICQGGEPDGVSFEKHLTVNSRVNFSLDMDRRICYLSVDGSEYLEAWMDLPLSSVYYPAVSLGDGQKEGKKGKVRIEVTNEFYEQTGFMSTVSSC